MCLSLHTHSVCTHTHTHTHTHIYTRDCLKLLSLLAFFCVPYTTLYTHPQTRSHVTMKTYTLLSMHSCTLTHHMSTCTQCVYNVYVYVWELADYYKYVYMYIHVIIYNISLWMYKRNNQWSCSNTRPLVHQHQRSKCTVHHALIHRLGISYKPTRFREQEQAPFALLVGIQERLVLKWTLVTWISLHSAHTNKHIHVPLSSRKNVQCSSAECYSHISCSH